MGRGYRYFCHRYNATWRNERAVEVPITLQFIRNVANLQPQKKLRVLELGNVLSHYTTLPQNVEHVVVDKYETAPGVINTDIIDFNDDEKFDLIVGISTLEHVGFDEPQKDVLKPLRAVRHLKTLLKPTGLGLLTIPVAYNPTFPLFLAAKLFGFSKRYFLKRISLQNEWLEVPFAAVKNCSYGTPYSNANGICVGFFESAS